MQLLAITLSKTETDGNKCTIITYFSIKHTYNNMTTSNFTLSSQ